MPGNQTYWHDNTKRDQKNESFSSAVHHTQRQQT